MSDPASRSNAVMTREVDVSKRNCGGIMTALGVETLRIFPIRTRSIS